MSEASRIQKLLTEQNAEIDRLKSHIEALEKSLGHCVRAIAEWERKPEGVAPYLLGALDHARKTLEPQP